jgi:hypothetical protein
MIEAGDYQFEIVKDTSKPVTNGHVRCTYKGQFYSVYDKDGPVTALFNKIKELESVMSHCDSIHCQDVLDK